MDSRLETVVEFQGQLTLEEVLRGFHLSRRSRRRTATRILVWVLAIAGAALLMRPALLPSLAWWLVPVAIFLLVFAVGDLILDLVILPLVVRKTMRQQQALYAPFRSRFDAYGYHSVSTQDTSERPWEYFRFWKEDRYLFLLAESPTAFRIIPKRLLETGDHDRLRQLLHSRLGKPA